MLRTLLLTGAGILARNPAYGSFPSVPTNVRQHPWRDFYTFRNSLLRVLQGHGTVGPMGEMPIREDWKASESAWQPAEADPEFFVVADMGTSGAVGIE